MNTEFYLRMGLLYVAQIAVFILALRVYTKRKESGFLVLAIAFGLQAVLALFGLLSMLGMGGIFQPLLAKLSSLVIYGPLLLALVGWALLAKVKNGSA